MSRDLTRIHINLPLPSSLYLHHPFPLTTLRTMDEINRNGLTELYCSGDPKVDIVFVHGLNGDPHDTWTSKSSKRTFWPRDLLPPILGSKGVRILTYGYDADVHKFSDSTSRDNVIHHAETLASALSANRNVSGHAVP